MATTKKKQAKKPAAVKKTTKKTVKKKAPKKKAIKKTTTKKTTTKKTSAGNNKIKVTLEQRHKMICEAAYYISLDKTYETVNPTEDWLQAESFIDQICTLHTS